MIRKWWSALGKPTQEPETNPDVVRRASEAKRVINEPLVIEAFEIIETEFTRLFIESAEADSDGRESAYRMLWSARRFKRYFEGIIETGVLHAHALEQLKRDR